MTVWHNKTAFFPSTLYVKQGSKLHVRAFTQNDRCWLVEQLPLGGRRCKQQASIFSEVTCKVTAPHRTAVHRYTWRSTVASEENFASICSLST